MKTKDFHEIPKMRDKTSYLYVEHAVVEKEEKAIALFDTRGKTPVPCAGLALLMLGPGTSITHAAITTLADCGCLVAWCGEHAVRFYATGTGTTRSAVNLLRQAGLWADPLKRLQVVRRMYEVRFLETLPRDLTLQQIRGKEGVRVRDTYARFSAETGIPWNGRSYNPKNWQESDPVNKALSAANSCLYGVCHAAIVAAGYSPALGFVHTGQQLSFVFDVADIYKTEITIPVAFKTAALGTPHVDREARIACRDAFHKTGLLKRIVKDLHKLMDNQTPEDAEDDAGPDQPCDLWDPVSGSVPGGVQYGDQQPKDQGGDEW